MGSGDEGGVLGRGGSGGGGAVVGVRVDAMGIKKLEKDANVFETGVHALPVKRHHSMRGIAEDDDRGGVVVRRAFYRYEW